MLNLKFSFLLLLGVFTFVACDDDEMEPVDPTPTPMNIAEIVADDDRFETLLAALQQADLVGTLQDNGPFTVFAPTDDAFAAAGIDLNAISDEALSQVLLYHVLGDRVPAADIAEGQTYVTTAATAQDEQLSLLIENSGGTVTLNGEVNVTATDVEATNGIIHVIDQVLMPPSVVDLAIDNDVAFSALVGALQAADGNLVDVLSGDGPFTVFAPTDAAFAEIQSTVDGLTTEQLSKVLTYHVVAGNNQSGDLASQNYATVNGEEFTVDLGAGTITSASDNTVNLVITDVQGTNGVVHVIDGVLIPENL